MTAFTHLAGKILMKQIFVIKYNRRHATMISNSPFPPPIVHQDLQPSQKPEDPPTFSTLLTTPTSLTSLPVLPSYPSAVPAAAIFNISSPHHCNSCSFAHCPLPSLFHMLLQRSFSNKQNSSSHSPSQKCLMASQNLRDEVQIQRLAPDAMRISASRGSSRVTSPTPQCSSPEASSASSELMCPCPRGALCGIQLANTYPLRV